MMRTKPFHGSSSIKDKTTLPVIWAVCLWVLMPLCSPGQPVPLTTSGRTPQAPPTAPPVEVASPQIKQFKLSPPPEGITPYSIGSPTDEEQLYLEYINRARANPPHEGWILATTTDPDVLAAYAYFGVDTNLMQSQFNAITSSPPVAMNAQPMSARPGRSLGLEMFLATSCAASSRWTNHSGKPVAAAASVQRCRKERRVR